MLPKVAVVLFVKDEFPDFCGWLAWYFSIGVDTIIVHDDHSTDGTWEAAVAASRCLDVRPFRTDLAIQPFTARQKDVYLGAVRQFRDEFDWIGFLDADEYLYLRERTDLPTFLARFPEAGAVAFSWCIYGSNRHILKPAASTVEAFTRHSLASFGHNRSVKSFVRPRLVIDQWRDPHTFEIGGAPYLDPQGRPVAWGGPGAIGHDPDWSVAKLMHFIPRSMEHFVDRIRRRSDLRGHSNEYWNVFNMNDVEDREPLKLLPGTRPFQAMIDREIMSSYAAILATTRLEDDDIVPAVVGEREDPGVCLVRTGSGTMLARDSNNRLVHLAEADLSDRGCSRVVAVSGSSRPATIILLAPGRSGPLGVANDPRLSSILAYHAEAGPESGKIRLRNPRTRRYLTALPPDPSGIGQTSGDRGEANAWETFELVRTKQAEDAGPALGFASRLVEDAPAVGTLIAMAREGADPMICAAAIQLLSAEQRKQLDRRVPPVLPSWV